LKATVQFDGPLLAVDTNNPHEINTGLALHEANVIYDKGRKSIEGIRFSDVIDFEHLNIAEELEENDQDSGEDGAGGDATDGSESIDERRHRRAAARRVALESRERREAHKRKQRSKVRMEGEPYVHTIQVPITGWYRFCIVGSYSQITAEIDLRKESDYGGIDTESGHVWTMQERTLEDEEKLMEADTAASEGIKDEDFEPTREKLKTLRRLLAEIQSKQSQERHRLIVHAATNEHSHSRMVLSSLLETILFMVVTGFQVFTIRRWFQSAPALGR
jgi:emp24/gp25L/p24 family/GOLD